jgi:hypothetical protein
METKVKIHTSLSASSPVLGGAAELPWPSASMAQAFMLVMLVAATFSFVHRYLPSVLVDPIKQELGINRWS